MRTIKGRMQKKREPFLLRQKMRSVVLVVFWCLTTLPMVAQGTAWTVSGSVKDIHGNALPGVNIVEEGTLNGTVSDLDGKYSIVTSAPDKSIRYSYIGYLTEVVEINGQENIDVYLIEDLTQLAEVVVVGYGVQKKVNVTGAVASVEIDDQISGRSLTNASSALMGLLPGLEVVQKSGMAGNDRADLKIRGVGSLNGGSPLIVVDGMPDVDINRININDIESVSILKDAASSAVYGSRAANGVILITTKSGSKLTKGKINYSGSYSNVQPTRITDFFSNYAKSLHLMQRETGAGEDRQVNFKDGTIDQWMAMSMIDPVGFPSTDWWDALTRNGVIEKHNLSFAGGTDKTNFYLSGGYLDQKGLMINNDYSQYNMRLNYDYQVSDKVKVGSRLAANTSKMSYAYSEGFTQSGNTEIFTAVAGIYPYDPELNRFGGIVAYGEDPQSANMMVKVLNDIKYRNRHETSGIMFFEWKPITGLTAKVDGSINYYDQFEHSAPMPTGMAYNFQLKEDGDKEYIGSNAGISNNNRTGYKTVTNTMLTYNRTIMDNHEITFLTVYSEEFENDRWLEASRDKRLHPALKEIDAASEDPLDQTTGGRSENESLRSFIGRFNYSAFDKYLFEANFRSDGSSRFANGYQYFSFPSASLGWRFSEEDFLNPLLGNWLSLGKLRASYGSLGSQVGVLNYAQKDVLDAAPYIYYVNNRDEVVKGFTNSRMINYELTWERTVVFDVGLDLGFFSNKLTTEMDYYNKLTTGMISDFQMSSLLSGAYDIPKGNLGDYRNKGVELNVTWKDRIAEGFSYMININASHNRARLEKYHELLTRGDRFLEMPDYFLYTYENTGIVQTWEEVYSSTPQGAKPGDILRKDLNGDGKIDSKDKKAFPKYTTNRPTTFYALRTSLEWNGIDLAIFLQGSAGRKAEWSSQSRYVGFPGTKYATSEQQWTNPWSLENREGPWPRLGGYGNNNGGGTFWVDNRAFLRLKNLQLGYTLPNRFTNKIGISGLRFYVTSENIFTLTKYRGLDPEKTSETDIYPINKSVTFGINLDI
jgi:TonB-dependent starch-binding outer membrane protein SusC